MQRFLLLAALTMIAVNPASAHTGVGDSAGFAHGFSHPLTGLDHVLAMLAAGLMAAVLGGRALWAVPLSFMAMMVAGAASGTAGIGVPGIELGIALSVIVLSVAIALHLSMPAVLAMALAGFFAIFHGYAHGAEMPDTASGLVYAAGFLLATGALHAVGVGIGVASAKLGQTGSRRAMKAAGGVIAVIGVVLLTVAA